MLEKLCRGRDGSMNTHFKISTSSSLPFSTGISVASYTNISLCNLNNFLIIPYTKPIHTLNRFLRRWDLTCHVTVAGF